MTRFRIPFMALFGLLTVVACDRNNPVEPQADLTAELPAIRERAPSATGEPNGDGTVPAKPLPAAATAIPASLHGRWGLTPGDCTSTRGDAKGLLVVSASDLRFYESRAVPGSDTQSGPNSISGNFDFTGEGESWTRYEALTLQDRKLIRTESNPTASFSYAKCD